MAERTWTADWEQRRAGVTCPMCAEGRTDVDSNENRRFFNGAHTDAYLHRDAPAAGYSTVRWRGRHVADISEMTDDERASFWNEVALVARAITEVFQPCHLNYDALGNEVPHVHVHIVPRYLDDSSPNMPLKPWNPQRIDDTELTQQAEALRTALRRT
jgi:diadenosine tetraphosphate (Ap4A) HIT family hydrolase